MIESKGFVVHAAGDPEVGISPEDFEVKGDFFFEDDEDLEQFRTELRKTFELQCDPVTEVLTIEEAEERAI